MTSFRALLVLLVAAVVAPALAAGGKPKVVVIGFDGADPKLVEQYRAQGLMPNLDRIAKDNGTFVPLMPTNPPQTPVSWSTFATGLNPGRTEIFDFLQRKEGAYQPDFALATREKKKFLFGERNGFALAGALGLLVGILTLLGARLLRQGWVAAGISGVVIAGVAAAALAGPISNLLPCEVPSARNNRQGTPFWTLAARNGMKVRVTHVPVTFPAEELPDGSTMISGLGVPDMRGRVGSPSYYTSDPNFSEGDNQFSLTPVRLAARRGAIETTITGPYNYPFHQYVLERAREQWKLEIAFAMFEKKF